LSRGFVETPLYSNKRGAYCVAEKNNPPQYQQLVTVPGNVTKGYTGGGENPKIVLHKGGCIVSLELEKGVDV
jgi:hypothetical protein